VIQGLTEQEVVERKRQGLGNPAPPPTTRTLRDILRANIFTSINVIVFSIAVALAAVGNWGDAITSGGLVFINAVTGIFQELRAKRTLDRIALLNRPRAIVLRRTTADAPSAEQSVDPADLVKDDVLVLQAGEQVMLDGAVVEGEAEVDESLLTGESDLITKKVNDKVMSGSFCVTGRALYRAEKVGMDSYANQLAAKARAFRSVKTPLQKDIDFVLRLLMLTAAVIGFMFFVSSVVNDLPAIRSLQAAAVIAGIVPNGLILAVLVAYSLGAVRIAQQGALVQQTNAIESLSNVDVLCTDKTGTLTANKIKYESVVPLNATEDYVKSVAADLSASAATSNRTSEAIVQALGGRKLATVGDVPFSSARKWSGVAFDNASYRGAFVMGAYEMLRVALQAGHDDHDLDHEIELRTGQGLRVLVLAHAPNALTLHDAAGQPALPDELVPLGLIVFGDELRPEARETIAAFRQAGIQLKVISGDDPNTVAALAKQAGFPAGIKHYSGVELEAMSPALFSQAAEDGTVFGRITPEQKERLVDALRGRGHYVAMIGDGVNDVLSLKKAQLGIAMQSGTSATRGVADMVLLNDSFAALVPAFTEGQRIVNGMKDILSLFMTRCFYVALIIIATGFVGVGFPFGPRNITLLTAVTVGLPTILLAYWAKPAMFKGNILKPVWSFVVPAVLTMLVFGLIVYVIAFGFTDRRIIAETIPMEEVTAFVRAVEGEAAVLRMTPQEITYTAANIYAQSVLTLFSLMAGLMLVLFVSPPFRFLAGGRPFVGDKRFLGLVIGLFAVCLIGWNIDPLRRFFAMAISFDLQVLGLVLAITAVWAFVVWFVWRQRLYERVVLGRNVVVPRQAQSTEASASAPLSQQVAADQGQR
jgi:cation-transporting ATPase E